MKIEQLNPPRTFKVGKHQGSIHHCATIFLNADEQVTFNTASGTEYDVVRKSWGYYATPSLNQRLPDHQLRPALVRGTAHGRYYILLVEKGHEKDFDAYLQAESMEVMTWFDTPSVEGQLRRTCLFCGSSPHRLIFDLKEAPAGETRFPFFEDNAYVRKVWQCENCGLYTSDANINLEKLYEGQYVDSTYTSGLRAPFERIMGLPPEKSDNVSRVQAIQAFMKEWWKTAPKNEPRVLDIGSGLCVFLAQMKKGGWHCTALDPDQRANEHATSTVGVSAILADFNTAHLSDSYDLITFNKVLEHVKDPIAMLHKAREHMRPDGIVYVELPDGEMASREGCREEFFIEHRYVFSMRSLSLLAHRAGFVPVRLERLREPSGKYTLHAYLAVEKGS